MYWLQYCALGLTGALFSPSSKKWKNPPRNKFLIFQKIELLSSNFKEIQETGTPKNKFLMFQEMETLKKLLIFRETEPFSPPRENFIFQETETPKKSLHFRKRKHRKNPYTSGNGTFLYFEKDIFRTLAYSEPWYI